MVRSFHYRSPRLRTRFRVDFYSRGITYTGECTDLSPEGLHARLNSEIPSGTEGELELHIFGRVHRVQAIVANLECEEVGFSFRTQTPEETQTLRLLVSEVGGLFRVD
jgi:hypothetical protein